MEGVPKSIMRLRVVRFKEGAKLYGVSEKSFIEMAREAGAVILRKQIGWVDLDIFDEYLNTFRVKAEEEWKV
jgi:hypothetical protein